MENTTDYCDDTQLEIITLTFGEDNDVSASCDDDDSNCSESSNFISTSFVVNDNEIVSQDNRESDLKGKVFEVVGNGSDSENTNRYSNVANADTCPPSLPKLELNEPAYYEPVSSDAERAEPQIVYPDILVKTESPESIDSGAGIDPECLIYEERCTSPAGSDSIEITPKCESVYYEEESTKISSYLRDTDREKCSQEITSTFSCNQPFRRRQGDGQENEIAENLNADITGDIDTNLEKSGEESYSKTSNNISKHGIKAGTSVSGKTQKCKCEFCKKIFSSKSSLGVHMMSHISEKNHMCEICEARFSQFTALKYHMRKHSGVTFPCPICKVEYKSKKGLESHTNSHNSGSLFRCQKCNKEFSALSYLRWHIKRHDGSLNKPYKCTHCGKRFIAPTKLREHEQTHFKKYYPCHLCDKTFGRRNSLKIHLKSHYVTADPLQRKEGYTCNACHKILKTKYGLEKHLKFHARSDNKNLKDFSVFKPRVSSDHSEHKYFLCDICGKKLMSESTLTLHKKVHSGDSPHVCKFCQRVFARAHDLLEHTRIHTLEKPYTCTDCNTRFARRFSLTHHLKQGANKQDTFTCKVCQKKYPRPSCLRAHSMTHTKEKVSGIAEGATEINTPADVKCRFCQTNFKDSKTLKKHFSINHIGEKPFICDFCRKQFMYYYSFAAHTKVHSGDSPHVCEYCQRVFSFAYDLVRHARIHTKDMPYTCSDCGKRFSQRVSLTLHLKEDSSKQNVYKCKICDSYFLRRNCLREHSKTHTAENSSIAISDNETIEYCINIIIPVGDSTET